MLDPADVRWIKSTANELNNLLQVIAESSEQLADFCRETPAAERYLSMMRDSVDRAALVTRSLSERVGGSPTDPVSAPTPSDAEAARLFPAERMPQPAAPLTPPQIEIRNPTGQRELVMVVDDEDFVTLLATKVLSNSGYRVVTAKDGFQALDIYRKLKDQISLVILDFTMPVMDGSDVFAELQQINPRVPVVLSSGFAEQERLGIMLARGLRGFIPKPYSNQKLIDQVRQTLDALHTEQGK
jgi:CheY-like chemotaxis protein